MFSLFSDLIEAGDGSVPELVFGEGRARDCVHGRVPVAHEPDLPSVCVCERESVCVCVCV